MDGELMSLRQIVEREGSCVAVFPEEPEDAYPVRAFRNYPRAATFAAELTEQTGFKHKAVLVMILR